MKLEQLVAIRLHLKRHTVTQKLQDCNLYYIKMYAIQLRTYKSLDVNFIEKKKNGPVVFVKISSCGPCNSNINNGSIRWSTREKVGLTAEAVNHFSKLTTSNHIGISHKPVTIDGHQCGEKNGLEIHVLSLMCVTVKVYKWSALGCKH